MTMSVSDVCPEWRSQPIARNTRSGGTATLGSPRERRPRGTLGGLYTRKGSSPASESTAIRNEDTAWTPKHREHNER